ncbi:MAG TPA: DUF6777 domain-containing protein [Streptomyces sp.]|nr:DUF6777 domain-containing protein [Streptomyces sp.]
MVRGPTGTLAAACALSAALLVVAGCGGDGGGGNSAGAAGEVVLEPAAAEGPDPFTKSTATAPAASPPVTRTPDTAPDAPGARRSYPGSTPGLYGGARRQGSCDVERQIDQLGADQGKARAFAEIAGVPQDSVPAYLRGLASVVLRADTRVTNHGYRAGRAAGYQSVLQAGTPVLVDDRGVPRVRCACGNPLTPPREQRGTPAHRGTPWTGYRPAGVIVVTPAPQVVTHLTIIDIADKAWIERRIGHDTRHDKLVPRPDAGTTIPAPPGGKPPRLSPPTSTPSDGPHREGRATPPGEQPSPGFSPGEPGRGCATPAVTVTPGLAAEADASAPASCPTATATVTAHPPADPHADRPAPESEPEPQPPPASPDGTGPEAVPDTPDTPDTPNTPAAPDGDGPTPDATEAADIIFGSPTDVFLS